MFDKMMTEFDKIRKDCCCKDDFGKPTTRRQRRHRSEMRLIGRKRVSEQRCHSTGVNERPFAP